MKKSQGLLGAIDRINERTGRIVGYFLVLVMFLMTFEVIMRYVFNRPTLWVNEMNEYLLLTVVALGGGYVLLHRGHVNVDVFYGAVTERGRAVLDLLTAPLFFLFMAVFLWQTWEAAAESWKFAERSTMAGIPTWPVRLVMVAGGCLLLLQGLAKFARDWARALGKSDPARLPARAEEKREGQR